MDLRNLFLLERNGDFFLFYSLSGSLFEVSEKLWFEINACKKNSSVISEHVSRCLEVVAEQAFAVSERRKQYSTHQHTPYLRLEISNICNNRCAYCHVFTISEKPSRDNFLPYEKADRLVEEYLELIQQFQLGKDVRINFYGGEPLLAWETIRSIVEKYGERRIHWSINTNGRLLNEDIIKFVRQHHVELHIGCDGPAEINDKVRRTEKNDGTFAQVQHAFQLATQHQVYKQMDAVISMVNMGHLRKLVDVAAANEIPFIYLDLLYKPHKLLNLGRTVSAYRDAMQYGKQRNVRVGGCCTTILNRVQNGQHLKHSKYGFLHYVVISSDGAVFPALSLVHPVSHNSLKEYFSEANPSWEADYQKVQKKYSEVCQACFLNRYCNFSGICQYQYHTKLEEGFEDSCTYLRDFVLAELTHEKQGGV